MTVTKTYCDRCKEEIINPVSKYLDSAGRKLFLSGIGREGGYDLCSSCYDELCTWFINDRIEEGDVNERTAESKETEKGNKIS